MTRFLDVSSVVSLIKQIGIENLLSQMADYIAEDYRHWADFEKAPRVASHSDVGVIELMPTANRKLYSFKYVNGHPANTDKNLPTVMAFGVLAEVETGLPILLSEMTVTTALRTAATSALAAKLQARTGSKVMAVIGCGSQSEFQILAFKLLGIRQIRAFDINPAAIEKMKRNLAGYDVEITVASSVADAVKGADIVTTLTAAKAVQKVLTADMIRPGMHLNAAGGDCPGKTELDAAIVKNARVMVEFEPQTRIEGEIQQMPKDFPVMEMWQVLTGAKKGRESDSEVTLYDSVGFALEDFSALRYLNDMAVKYKAGRDIELIADLKDPRDLFAVLK